MPNSCCRFYFSLKGAITVFVTVAMPFMLGGCVSESTPNAFLEKARAAYAAAETNPEVKANAPVALYEAFQALEKAEKTQEIEDIQHLSYLTEKQVEIALAQTAQKKEEQEMGFLAKEKEKLILEARQREAEKHARDAKAAREEAFIMKSKAEQLKAEAEAKAREAQEALAKAAQLESELEALKAVKTDRGMVLTLGDVLFATGKADLAPGAKQTIDHLAAFLAKYPERKVRIEGHTDSVGSDEYNLTLSDRRAQAVKLALLERGIAFGRIATMGYGKTRPIADNSTEGGRQKNRRVEIIIMNPDDPAT